MDFTPSAKLQALTDDCLGCELSFDLTAGDSARMQLERPLAETQSGLDAHFERSVVRRVVLVGGEVTQIDNIEFHKTRRCRTLHHAFLQEAVEHLWKERDDIDFECFVHFTRGRLEACSTLQKKRAADRLALFVGSNGWNVLVDHFEHGLATLLCGN